MYARWALELNSGARVGLGRNVTTIGRSARCDIVIADPSVSRRQLLVCVRERGVEVINVGKQPASLDGAAITESVQAVDGQAIEIAGDPVAVVRRIGDAPEGEARARWFLRVDDGPMIGVNSANFKLGGGASDNLVIHGWPAGALTFDEVEHALVVEASRELAVVPSLDADGFGRLCSGDTLTCRGTTIEARSLGGAEFEQSTVQRERVGVRVRLETFRSGGILVIERDGDTRSVHLARRRYALLRALLTRSSRTAGGFHSVEGLCRAIWPNDPVKDSTDFNVLLYRLRRELVRAGIDASLWIERARGSGMVRSPMTQRADVEVRID